MLTLVIGAAVFGVLATVLLSIVNSLFMRKALERMRSEIASSLQSSQQHVMNSLTQLASLTQNQLDVALRQNITQADKSAAQLEQMRTLIDSKLEAIRLDNQQKLEQMRATVDEKLHQTLEKRLGESFKIVSDQLSVVNKSLGEMQSLADGVGDLKRVLTNVKSRGMLGEYQLHAILQDILSAEQYAQNVVTKKGSSERVEFAIRLPGKHQEPIWLPIDAKFPKEDYERLLLAHEKGNLEEAETYRKAIATRLKTEAKTIAAKYIDVPQTTDFALLFLPLEGLYAEVLSIPGLAEEIQKVHRVVIAGPTTLTALLSSLQMGFKTLAIQQRSSEVWRILAQVKTEFSRFGVLLERTKKRLGQASDDLNLAYRRTEHIQKRLVSVESDSLLSIEEEEDA